MTCHGQEQWLHARVEEGLDVTPVQGTEVLLAHSGVKATSIVERSDGNMGLPDSLLDQG